MPKRKGWKDKLNGDPVTWLLEPDLSQPAVRYFTLRDITGLADDAVEVKEARAAIMRSGPVPKILAAQEPEGYWAKPGAGYSPKYRSTVWQVMFLAQLGADGSDSRVKAGCEYLLDHAIASRGWFSYNGTPSGFIHCLAGNLGAALIDMGYLDDTRLQKALEMQARFVTGDGMADISSMHTEERFNVHTPGPDFVCRLTAGQACAWGAIKALHALSKVPPRKRTKTMKQAIAIGIELLLSRDPAIADYPTGAEGRISPLWTRFHYPLGYSADMLQNLEILAALGKAQDPRLASALEMVISKQDERGRWTLEHSYNSRTWTNIERKGKPSKWVTLRALRVLKAAYPGGG